MHLSSHKWTLFLNKERVHCFIIAELKLCLDAILVLEVEDIEM
jgi:hypothetical protein